MAFNYRYVPKMNNQQEVFNNFLNKTINPTKLGDSDQHLVTIFGIVLQTRAKKILELGVRWGDTSEPLVCGASIIGGHLTAVDISPTQWVCPDDLKPYYTFVQSEAIVFLEQEVAKGSHYDIVYVDDWHAYEHVKRELELIDKLTDRTSIILLHDLTCFSTDYSYNLPILIDAPVGGEWSQGGPTRAVLELDKEKWEWATIPFNNGLTILRKVI